MNKALLGFCLLLACVPAQAQHGGGRQGGGPPGGREGAREGPPRMREIEPVSRAKFDKIVTAMFHEADQNRDGLVTMEEIRAIAGARRDILIGKRFERIDTNKDRTISREEFFAWQHGLGSVAQSDEAQTIGPAGLIPETVAPEYDDERQARLLAGLIEPLSTGLVTNANLNYDAGLSLEELLAYEGKRFDEADRDRNGAISMGEAPQPEGRRRGGRGGPPPGGPAEPPPGTE